MRHGNLRGGDKNKEARGTKFTFLFQGKRSTLNYPEPPKKGEDAEREAGEGEKRGDCIIAVEGRTPFYIIRFDDTACLAG